MGKAGRVAGSTLQGAGTGAALGASIGSAVPVIGNVVGGVVGAVGGGLAGFFGGMSSDEEEEDAKRRAQTAALFAQQQQLQKDQFRARSMQAIADSLGSDPAFGMKRERERFDRGQALDKAGFDLNMQPAQQPGAYEQWIAPAIGAASSIAGSFRSDPRAARKALLNQTADEANWINSQDLPNRATALAENEERTRTALFGSRNRMNRYDF